MPIDAIPPAPPLDGGEVRAVRDMLGLTQREFAKMIGVQPFTVSMWECGRRVCAGPAAVLLRAVRDGRFQAEHP